MTLLAIVLGVVVLVACGHTLAAVTLLVGCVLGAEAVLKRDSR